MALNVALYGADGRRWTMTERGAACAMRDARSYAIGPSRLAWDGATLTVSIDEVCAPWPQRVRGIVRVRPRALHAERHALDAAGRHHWQPIAPVADGAVDLDAPHSRWRGHAYVDRNQGEAPLERDFRRWHWSRARTASGRSGIVYDIERRDGSALSLALAFDADGRSLGRFEPPPVTALPRSAWRIARETRSEGAATLQRSLEDGPFYARAVVGSTLLGEPAVAVHETLDLDRFASRWVQAMLPFRMPRRQ